VRSASLFGVVGALLLISALTPARAADMSHERALNPQREPQNWILHHGNYQGSKGYWTGLRIGRGRRYNRAIS
jgi:hypothetical protein